MVHDVMGNLKYYLFGLRSLPVLPLGGRRKGGGETGLLFDYTTKNKGYVMKPLI